MQCRGIQICDGCLFLYTSLTEHNRVKEGGNSYYQESFHGSISPCKGWVEVVRSVALWMSSSGRRPFSSLISHFTEMCKKTPWHLGVNGSLQLKTAHTGYYWWHHKKTPGKLIRSSIKSVKTVRVSSMQVRISDLTFVDNDNYVWLMSPDYDSCWFRILKIGFRILFFL